MKAELEELLVSGLHELGIETEALLPFFKLYFSELSLWNPKLGLIEADDREIISKHFLDCAAGYDTFRSQLLRIHENYNSDGRRHLMRIVDLGSGSGLPGIILLLLLRREFELELHLVEKQKRRCGFLRNVVPILGLSQQVKIRQMAFEEIHETFDVVTSRAFRNMTDEQLQLQKRFVSPGGAIIAYKGKLETLRQEMGANFGQAEIVPVSVPGNEAERHLLVIEM